VTEIVDANRCMASAEAGDDQVVQDARINPTQTASPICAFPTATLVRRLIAAFDRFGREGEITLTLPGSQCAEPGPAVGDFGGVHRPAFGSNPFPTP